MAFYAALGILSEPAKMVIETDKKQAEAVGIVVRYKVI